MKKNRILFGCLFLVLMTARHASAQVKQCLFVSATAVTGNASEALLMQKMLEWGYNVTIINTTTLATFSSVNFAVYDVCFASESVGSSALAPLKKHPIPLVTTEAWASKPQALSWCNPASAINISPEPVLIVDSTDSPLAAGFRKDTTVAIADTGLIITTAPTISVIPIAVSSSNPARSIIYGIEQGTILTDGSITVNRAACIGIHEYGYLTITEGGYAFIRAAMEWVIQKPPFVTPSLSVTPASRYFGNLVVNSTSLVESYRLAGSNLTPADGMITITAPAGFQISETGNSGFGSSVVAPYAGGMLQSKQIYVRFAPTAVQYYNASVTHAGGGATTQTVAVSGTGVHTMPASLADGFGRNATGGQGGAEVTTGDSAQFIAYAESPTPYVITLTSSLTTGRVNVASNKTIQGANASITVNGGFRISNVNNVIIRNVNITNPSGFEISDGMEISGSTNVYVTHCTFTDCPDGELDIVRGSDWVTVSWCRFRYVNQTVHKNVTLIGNADDALGDVGKLHVTMHHNWWDNGCLERMPRVRYGRVHCYNNYYGAPGSNYCIGIGINSQILVENCSFDNQRTAWRYQEISTGGKIQWRNLFMVNTVIPVEIPNDSVFDTATAYTYIMDGGADVKGIVTANAGNRGMATGVDNNDLGTFLPDGVVLLQNYPNPFNPTTEMQIQNSKSQIIDLRVYDLLGREVAVLVDGSIPAGSYRLRFNAGGLSGGVYVARLQAGSSQQTMKLVLTK